jgi:hypothetical protein
VHGLLSTDVGTFDQLRCHLKSRIHLGFPHNSLGPIGSNADELAKHLRSLNNEKIRYGIVAHSRGGLVARAALARLRLSKKDWAPPLLTFGTPHNGAYLASSSPSRFLALALVGALLAKTEGSSSLCDALRAIDPDELPGITDMRRRTASENPILRDIQKAEMAKPDRYRLGAVSGSPRRVHRWQKLLVEDWMPDHVGESHDGVVSTESCCPWPEPVQKTKYFEVDACHSTYFKADTDLGASIKWFNRRLS